MRRVLGVGVILGLAAWANEAEAQRTAHPVVELVWSAPSDCPSGESVVKRVGSILGGDASGQAVAHAEVDQLGPLRWSVHLVTNVDGFPGERRLEADSCAAVAAATALILAWTIDPARAGAAKTALPTSEVLAPAPAPPAAPQPLAWPAVPAEPIRVTAEPVRMPVPVRPAPAPRAPREPRRSSSTTIHAAAVAALGGAANVGTLPEANLGGELTLGVLVGRLRAEVSAGDWLAANTSKTAGAARLHMLDGALRGCVRLVPSARFEVAPCLAVAIDYATAAGSNESATFSNRSANWWEARAEIVLALRLVGPLFLRGRVGAGVPFARPAFTVEEPAPAPATTLHQVGVVSGLAGLGLEAHFP